MNYKEIDLRIPVFLWLYIILLFLVLPFVVMFDKGQTHLIINQFHHPNFDIFFKNITHLGDGLFAIFIGFLLLFFSYRYSILIVSTYAISGIIVQLLKKLVFFDIDRPFRFFGDLVKLHWVDGVEILKKESFPSGHSATAFALFTCMAIIINQKYFQVLFFFVALLIAFSRVYLSLHFLTDIIAGSVVGVLVTWAVYKYLFRIHTPWIDRSIVSKKKSS